MPETSMPLTGLVVLISLFTFGCLDFKGEFGIADATLYKGSALGSYSLKVDVMKNTSSMVPYSAYVNNKPAKVFYSYYHRPSFNQTVYITIDDTACPLELMLCTPQTTHCSRTTVQCN